MVGFVWVGLVPLRALRPHEMVDPRNVSHILASIRSERVLHDPVYVDAFTGVILDGHHRVTALSRLGARFVPAVLVNYLSPLIRVGSWRAEATLSKFEVLSRGLTGRLFPPKTSRHVFPERITGLDVSLSDLL